MVGVPRSQGCRNCRRKKKGCDLQKPVCGQCARLGLPCGWDPKQYSFVAHNPAPEPAESSMAVRSRSNPDLTRQASGTPLSGSPERSLARTAAEIDLISKFWDDFLPKDQGEDVGGTCAGAWAKSIRTLSEFDNVVHTCMLAVASTAVGRLDDKPELVQEGTRLYARALRETNRALQDPVSAQSDATLAAVKLLSTYESFRVEPSGGISTQGHDWQKHIEGTCHIVELRGPEKHVADHGHALFEEARMLAIISGLSLRKPNFFTSRAWYTIPWETHPRNLRDELCDIMIALPDALCRQDALTRDLVSLQTNQDIFATLTDAQNHMSRCLLIAASLRDWEQRALAVCLEQTYMPLEGFTGPLTLFEVCRSHGYGFFHTAMTYFVACLILYSTIWVIKRNIMLAIGETQQSDPDAIDLPTLLQLPEIPAWIDPRPAASSIARCVSHYFEPEAGYWGPSTATFPMGAALHYYAASGGQDSAEMEMLRDVLRTPRLGSTASQFLRSMANSSAQNGDCEVREQHKAMTSSWYGTDVFERRQQAE